MSIPEGRKGGGLNIAEEAHLDDSKGDKGRALPLEIILQTSHALTWWTLTADIFEEERDSDERLHMSGVAWYWPTHWIKTFHPRTMGHDGYRKLILEAWTAKRSGAVRNSEAAHVK